MLEKVLHSFEAGRRGKPDELDANIAHLIGAFLLELNPNSRFDLDISGDYSIDDNKPIVRVGGEISEFLLKTPDLKDRISKIILDYYNKVHRSCLKLDEIKFDYNFKPQSESLASNGYAGDLANPIAVAYRYTPRFLPWERFLAIEIRDFLDTFTVSPDIWPPYYSMFKVGGHEGFNSKNWFNKLKPDGKVFVSAFYEGAKLSEISSIDLHVEHGKDLDIEELRSILKDWTLLLLQSYGRLHGVNLGNPNVHINTLCPWNQGGWQFDSGNREAKPYRDGFATYGVNEDSFSGEDPTKPSATGTMIARYIGVQIVGNNLADFVRVYLKYTLGEEQPAELNITTNGTGRLRQSELEQWVRKNIPLGVNAAIKLFNLRDPKLYRKIVQASDFFHDPIFPWNKKKLVYR